ncbi:hypothetical protein AVEN_168898-1 [Araneus ventricosus]|uniref:Uncharacterized protein n=1 Tax=Araneus ventricosus TaxID=182803 RepID=A0A4Y2TI89_ARAVE|nr:hypothetical protein AVEN_168898-1 [Araneus ventricosus]
MGKTLFLEFHHQLQYGAVRAIEHGKEKAIINFVDGNWRNALKAVQRTQNPTLRTPIQFGPRCGVAAPSSRDLPLWVLASVEMETGKSPHKGEDGWVGRILYFEPCLRL